ncbi:MAG: cytochrome c3 family protein [Bacteroidales bacterium]
MSDLLRFILLRSLVIILLFPEHLTAQAPSQLTAPQLTPQQLDSVYNRKTFSPEEIIRGERLFYGLAFPADKNSDCARCHNTRVSDTLNWNPDAYAISVLYKTKSARDLSAVLLTPSGIKLSQVHNNFKLTPEDVVLLKAFMDRFAAIGLAHHKPVVTNLLLFIFASLLFLISATDSIITKRLRRRWINYVVLTATGAFIVYTLVADAVSLGRSQYYSPDQPIKFSHYVHASQNQIDCIYCHSYAHVSKSSGIPPTNVCMNCHLVIRNGSRSGTFEISKIISSYDNNTPVNWIKVHNLPDFVFFSHAQHTVMGKVECSECHGDVPEMNLIIQVSDLSMGWCVNCHRNRKVTFLSDKFFTQYRDLSDKIRTGMIDSVTVEMIGGTDCGQCHY